jgi:hypothetical protein
MLILTHVLVGRARGTYQQLVQPCEVSFNFVQNGIKVHWNDLCNIYV